MKILFLCLLLSFYSATFSQSLPSKTISLFAFINDNPALQFSPADMKGNLNVGIGINYEQRLNHKLTGSIIVAGSFNDSAVKKQIRFSEKRLFVETDISLRYDLLNVKYRVQPFLSSGLGVSYFSNHLGMYAPVGLGSRIMVNNDITM